MTQKEFFDQDLELAESLKNQGMQQAIDSANEKDAGWSDKALAALIEYVRENADDFMVEDVRSWANWVPNPPSKRAWGGVVVKAAKQGLIERTRYGLTSNPKAHCTPAAVWRRVPDNNKFKAA